MKVFKPFLTLQPEFPPTCSHSARKILVKADRNITKLGDVILGKITYDLQHLEEPIELVRVHLQELDIHNQVTYPEIIERALECGLRKCAGILGPMFRLAYTNQPLSEELLIGMDTVPSSDNIASVFCVSNHAYSGLCLDGVEVYYKKFIDREFIFRK